MKFSQRILILFLLCVFGCNASGNPDGRIDVTGTITLNGKPFTFAGGCFFEPVNGIKEDGGVSQILDGKIFLTGQAAPKPGKYIVRIYAIDYYDKTTNLPITPETKPGNFYTVKVIPDDFNINSTIEFEVVAKKKNVFNYNIVTDDKP
ncbi:MAG: hypothetical protein LBQ54_09640 [Planctomycetaceae bacterium]|jgi:hypothetical protein|nr:hypothetical protein [Planctomycetaceae bacterium]